MALLFLVVGLDKFGFPEILLHMYSDMKNANNDGWRRVKDLLEGLATVLHYSSATLIISAFLTGALIPDRF